MRQMRRRRQINDASRPRAARISCGACSSLRFTHQRSQSFQPTRVGRVRGHPLDRIHASIRHPPPRIARSLTDTSRRILTENFMPSGLSMPPLRCRLATQRDRSRKGGSSQKATLAFERRKADVSSPSHRTTGGLRFVFHVVCYPDAYTAERSTSWE